LEGHLISNAVFINSKVQVIVLGSTAVIGLVYIIKSAATEICDRNGKLRHFDKFSFKVVCDQNGKLQHFNNFFQNCSLKETTNPEYIEKFISFTLRVTVEY
jgi:hypothetical protein